MKGPDGFVQAYNVQIAVDELQLIVGQAVTQETNDKKQLLTMITTIAQQSGDTPPYRRHARTYALFISRQMLTSALSHSAFASVSKGLLISCAAWYSPIGVSSYKHGLMHTHRMVSSSAFAAASSGGNSSFAINSDAKKSGLTSRTATLVVDNTFRISSRHSDPGLICKSDHTEMLSFLTMGFNIV